MPRGIIVLICGLPSSGKTTLADSLACELVEMGHSCERVNADEVRGDSEDWDFSLAGRARQSRRMFSLATDKVADADVVLADFVCPTKETRALFHADVVVWMNTVTSSPYKDTDDIFQPFPDADLRITSFDASNVKRCAELICKIL